MRAKKVVDNYFDGTSKEDEFTISKYRLFYNLKWKNGIGYAEYKIAKIRYSLV